MNHIPEDDLIAYHLREPGDDRDDRDVRGIRAHFEACSDCAALSDSIAETLRVFSSAPIPHADLDLAWQNLQGRLPSAPAPSSNARRFSSRPWALQWRRPWVWSGIGIAFAMILLAVSFNVHTHRSAERRRADLAFDRPGPLTEQPTDPAIANHLDSAERLLTEVNHASGPLDETTRSQAHDLLLKNAVYVHQARDGGDLAEASILENLGRVLTTLDHEPPPDKGWHIRLEMNTDGLLLDIRILRQNDARQ